MKKIFFTIFSLIYSFSFSQYAIATLWKYEEGGRLQARDIILNEFKEVAEKRIADGNLNGYHVWQAVNWSNTNQFDLIVVELYDDLEKFYVDRGLQKNLNMGAWGTHNVWSKFLNSVELIDRIILKGEAFENTNDYLTNLTLWNFYEKSKGELGKKWVDFHKKFSKKFVEKNRALWGSWSIIHKSFNTKFDHLTIDGFDYKNEMEFLMKHKNQPVDWSAATKYWGKTKFSDARKPIERAFFTQLLIL